LAHVRPDAHVVIQDVDRPFVSPELIEALQTAHTTFGYTAPIFNGEAGHPILLSPFLVNALRDDASKTLREALSPFPRRDVQWDDLQCGTNINDPDDYAEHFPEQLESVI
jgi:CTP:molybdopterin cytidylyltransferase MocA